MSFTLPDLPYQYDALAPYMSRETLEYHHDKHHLAYVNTANNLIKGTEWEGKSLEDVVKGAFGKNAGLFNNAGGQYRAALETISTKGFEAVVRNNLTGGFIVMREVYTKWMKAHGGAIVNMIADIWHGWPHFAHSASARGGMLSLSESAATEWAAAGVRVNTIAPGAIASSGLDTYDDA